MSETRKPKPIPDRYRRVTPALVVDGFIVDPFGHGWTIGSHVADLAPDEIIRRMSEFAEAG